MNYGVPAIITAEAQARNSYVLEGEDMAVDGIRFYRCQVNKKKKEESAPAKRFYLGFNFRTSKYDVRN